MTWNLHQNRSQKSRNRVRCQWMTIAKWLLRVPAHREKILSGPFRRRGCLHTHDVRHTRDRFRSFAKHGFLHTHDVRHTRDRFCSFAKHGCLHTHDLWRARILQWEYGCAHTHDILRVLYSFVVCLLLCLFIQTHQFWWARVSVLYWQSHTIS